MIKKIALLMSVLSILVCLSLTPAGAKEVYINGIDFGFPPFGYVDKAGKPAGFDVECANWIANEMGFEVKHQPMDWDGIIPALNAKKIDFIASGMSATESRKKIVNFTLPYYEVSQVLLVLKGQPDDFNTLLTTGKKIGTQRGTTSTKLLNDLLATGKYNFKIVEYDSTDLSMEDLKIGRIDGSSMDSSIANELNKDETYKTAGTFEGSTEEYGYAVRKGDDKLLNLLNQGLKKLMADPQWQVLKDKYDIH
ncbi:ABC transporter substrate-binding protein [uncultured Desulfobacter sp.]|uniref:ABC transporter substrate-binding protein n=1 Tax=uncultured Desulfobacter sp. TaxID=240139 RepID=UPI0029F49BA5|nr:ABC transporter substrate-binding protein [uncultured Desulfobacter sp.]